jgi:hypothetical protein
MLPILLARRELGIRSDAELSTVRQEVGGPRRLELNSACPAIVPLLNAPVYSIDVDASESR